MVVLRNRGIDVRQSGLPLWIGINLLIGFAIPGISIGGHIGGLIGGSLAALALFDLPKRLRALPPLAPAVLAAVVGVLAVVGSYAVV